MGKISQITAVTTYWPSTKVMQWKITEIIYHNYTVHVHTCSKCVCVCVVCICMVYTYVCVCMFVSVAYVCMWLCMYCPPLVSPSTTVPPTLSSYHPPTLTSHSLTLTSYTLPLSPPTLPLSPPTTLPLLSLPQSPLYRYTHARTPTSLLAAS